MRSLRFDKDTNSSQNMNSLLFNFNWFICFSLVIVMSFSYSFIYNSFNFVQVLD